ncbi:MAG: adenosylcobinamide-GDP ribazoletransferase [Methylococcaceae bacterium]
MNITTLKNQFLLLQLALSFYTRLPISKNLDYSQLSKASIYLPVVGYIVGSLIALVYLITTLYWSQQTAVILSFIAGILITGGFHEDGFADVCDGFGGGYSKEQILLIMKDSRLGTYGVLGLLFLILLKISLLTQLNNAIIPSLLFVAHSSSRFAPLVLMHHYNYAREQGKGSAVVFKRSIAQLLLSGSLALLPFLLLPPLCLLAIIPMLLITFYLGYYFNKHIEGYTGDCLGAVQQINEVMFYLTVAGLWTFI